MFPVGTVLRPEDHSQLPGWQGVGLVAAMARYQAKPQELKVRRDKGNAPKSYTSFIAIGFFRKINFLLPKKSAQKGPLLLIAKLRF